jgi:hypothetical protein
MLNYIFPILDLLSRASLRMIFNTNLIVGTTISLPLFGRVDVEVDWGDGTVLQRVRGSGFVEHVYAENGIYEVVVSGRLSQFGSGFQNWVHSFALVSVEVIEGVRSLDGAFRGARNLIFVPQGRPSKSKSFEGAFWGVENLNQDFKNWNVSSKEVFNPATFQRIPGTSGVFQFFMCHELKADPEYFSVFSSDNFRNFSNKDPLHISNINNLGFIGTQALTSIGDYIFAVDGGGRLRTINWQNRSAPFLSNTLTFGGGQVYDVGADFQKWVVTASTSSGIFRFIDVSAPGSPLIVNQDNTGGVPSGVTYSNGTFYGTSFSTGKLWSWQFDGFVWVRTVPTGVNTNLPNPSRPSIVNGALYVLRYLSNQIEIYDLSNPAIPTFVRVLNVPQPVSIYNPASNKGNRLYLAQGTDIVVVYDVTNPLNPKLLSAESQALRKRFKELNIFDVLQVKVFDNGKLCVVFRRSTASGDRGFVLLQEDQF